jgi:hypothetical protein
VGLLLGPAAVVLGVIAWRRERLRPEARGAAPPSAAIVLGLLVLVTNWAGLAFLVIGLSSL